MNIAQTLRAAQAQGLARLDVQLLLLHALGKADTERAWLVAHDGDAVALADAVRFDQFCERRAGGEPLAYIVKCKAFFGLRFAVDARVLVPRPDTETLVEWALDILNETRNHDTTTALRVLDLGTGSGAVAIAVATKLAQTRPANGPCAQVTAVDASADALAVAQANALALSAEVSLLRSDWLGQVSGYFHVIASNPPYIASADPHLDALRHEPLSALAAGPDGLDDIRRIVADAPAHLLAGGWLLLEHGYDQAAAVCALLEQVGFVQVQSRLDLAGIARCSGGQWRRAAGVAIEIAG
ncbi:MAG: peptide chain release factor N(5)-glutamine methyltransferase [Chitinophagaceae bacterium]|nr:peptide chain release factor N(5)-glutamine methyltransferase [Polaromonas sp.]